MDRQTLSPELKRLVTRLTGAILAERYLVRHKSSYNYNTGCNRNPIMISQLKAAIYKVKILQANLEKLIKEQIQKDLLK